MHHLARCYFIVALLSIFCNVQLQRLARLLQFPGNLRWIPDHCGKTDCCSLPLLSDESKSQLPEAVGFTGLHEGTAAVWLFLRCRCRGRFPSLTCDLNTHFNFVDKSCVRFWQKAAPLANVRENCYDRTWRVLAWEPSLSSAYKADSRYYGKSNKNSWNWRYAAWTAVALPCVRQSEIFLNFAPQPTLRPVISSCPPTQPPVSSGPCNWSPPYCFCLAHAKKKKDRRRERRRHKTRSEETRSNPMISVSQLDEEIIWTLGWMVHDLQAWNVNTKGSVEIILLVIQLFLFSPSFVLAVCQADGY